jgi:maleate isomerase
MADNAGTKRKSEEIDGKVDGVSGFQAGQRDFSAASGTQTKAIKADFENATKEYTNGVVAKNSWRSHKGKLTGETVRIPDVSSGYPKGVFPTKWQDGKSLPEAVEAFDIGDGFPDVNEFKMKFGVVIPSTNTTVEYDFWRMIMRNEEATKGIGFHVSGILIDAPKLATDEDMLNFLTMFRKQIYTTVDRLMTAEPQYIIMGMSLETFFGGWEGNKEFKKELGDRTGLNIATGAEACKAALDCFKAKKITIITPYQEIGDRNVVKFFSEIGAEVVRVAGLKCGSATDIAHVPESWCEKVIKENLLMTKDGKPGVDAIVQCGTNLSMVNLSDRLEQELGLPIIPINTACLWFAMRECGIETKLQGCTRLFREH